MYTNDAQGNRNATSSVDDTHQIGILQIVVGRTVSAVTVVIEDDFLERGNADSQISCCSGVRMSFRCKCGQVGVIFVEARISFFQSSQQQCRTGKINSFVAAADCLPKLLEYCLPYHLMTPAKASVSSVRA